MNEVTILGAGIAGLSTAIALAQKGIPVTVYEKSHAPAHLGAGIVIWSNGSFVLSKLGILSKFIEKSTNIQAMKRYTQQGETLSHIDIDLLSQDMGYPSLSISRKACITILTDTLKALDVSVKYAHNVHKIDAIKEKTCIEFTNGKVIQPDIVIGADGRYDSPSRQYVHNNAQAIYQGVVNFLGICTIKNKNILGEISDYWGVGKRFGIVDLKGDILYWAGAKAISQEDAKTFHADKKTLIKLFQDFPPSILNVIKQTKQEDINKVLLYDYTPTKLWHKNNLLLIGDAAHAALPTSGQGANQAFEDAWHLSECFEKAQDYRTIFPLFESIRFEKTANITIFAREFSKALFHHNQEQAKQRDKNEKLLNHKKTIQNLHAFWASGLPM